MLKMTTGVVKMWDPIDAERIFLSLMFCVFIYLFIFLSKRSFSSFTLSIILLLFLFNFAHYQNLQQTLENMIKTNYQDANTPALKNYSYMKWQFYLLIWVFDNCGSQKWMLYSFRLESRAYMWHFVFGPSVY